MTTCRAIGCEPYLAANLRSLPARDFYQWVEYCNAPCGQSPLQRFEPRRTRHALAARARPPTAAPSPSTFRYWGVGNEMLGLRRQRKRPKNTPANCTAASPSGCPELQPAHRPHLCALKFVAVGANGDDVPWVSAALIKAPSAANPETRHLSALSTHYYTSGDAKTNLPPATHSSLQRSRAYYDLLARGSFMERIITDQLGRASRHHGHPAQNQNRHGRVGRLVRQAAPMLSPHYNLSQQSTMRDALLSGITLDIFQRHPDKVAMANVAQSINCIHSLMLAQEDKFTVTPTFHVFQMYLPHRGATAVRAEFSAPTIANPMAGAPIPVGGNSYLGSIEAVRTLAGLSGSASMQGKTLTLSVVNPHLDRPITAEIAVRNPADGTATIASVRGTVLASPDIHDHNDFAHPNAVHPIPATTGQPTGSRLLHTFPPASVTTLQLTLA